MALSGHAAGRRRKSALGKADIDQPSPIDLDFWVHVLDRNALRRRERRIADIDGIERIRSLEAKNAAHFLRQGLPKRSVHLQVAKKRPQAGG